MGVMLVSLQFSNEASIRKQSGGAVIHTDQVSSNGFHAHLILTPDGDPELEKLGFVHLRIEAEPERLPDMTREETVAWLRKALKRFL